jgi:hypothetical protein
MMCGDARIRVPKPAFVRLQIVSSSHPFSRLQKIANVCVHFNLKEKQVILIAFVIPIWEC